MAKRSTDRLQTVLKLARLRQRLAAEQLGATTHNAETQRQQAEQLRHYQHDYGEHFKALKGRTLDGNQLGNFQGFYRQLEQVIDTQDERVQLAGEQREAARQQWQKQYMREKNLRRLVERRELEETLEQDKKHQREQDDRPRRKPD